MDPRFRRRRRLLTGLAVTAASAGWLAGPAQAYNYVPTANGEAWGVQDAAAPRVDTGSIRDTNANGNLSAVTGFGGIRVKVSTDALRNGELVRGFGLRFDPPERFTPTSSVDMGGVAVSRQVRFNRTANWGRWLDTFKNTTGAPITVDVSFGGQTGVGTTSTFEGATVSNNGIVSQTSSGDTTIGPDDTWALTRFGTGPTSHRGPSAVVFGQAAPFAGALTRTGNFHHATFTEARAATGHESNFIGYEHRLVLQPGETRSLVHFVVIGTAESSTAAAGATNAPGAQVTAVQNTASTLSTRAGAGAAMADLTKPELCSLANWDVASLTGIRAFSAATDCVTAGAPAVPAVAPANPTTTGSTYDVVGKTMDEMQADMAAGRTTSQQITRAYLDRIAAYDVGPFGFNSYTTVAKDAMAQAKAADEARAAGRRSPVLGLPMAIKDLYDTKDMPTTNGSLVFEGYQPPSDATSVARLRDAGAVILGKASLEEYALSGQYSDSAFGIVWNAFSPSRSSLASSGGPAVATALSMAAGSLGSQTGDSLYAPASAASLYTLRGTDGMESLANVMPLSWMQDYAGAITRSLSDLADILDVTTGTDPLDAERTAEADARRPKEWRDTLDPNALKGKRIGYYPAAFVDPFGTTGTVNAELAQLEAFRDAGATLVALSEQAPNGTARLGPVLPANTSNFDLAYQGWAEYIKTHPNLPYQDPREILASQKRLPYRRSANGYVGLGGGTPAQIQTYKDYRAAAKVAVANWLDNPPNPVVPGTTTASPGALDSVVYPGLKSTISLNDGNQAAFGRGDPPSNSAGTPTVAFPSGVNDEGEPTDLQIVGRAWDDGKLMGYAYAYDQTAKAHIEPTTAPRLTYKADPTPPVVEQPAPIAPEATVTPAPSPGSGTPATTPAKVVGPVLSNNAVRATKRRAVGFRVRCSPAPGAIRCRGSLKVTLAGRTIATRAFSIPAGRTVTVHVTLSKSAYRTLVARRSLRVAVRLRAPDSAGVTRVKTARITVRAPKR